MEVFLFYPFFNLLKDYKPDRSDFCKNHDAGGERSQRFQLCFSSDPGGASARKRGGGKGGVRLKDGHHQICAGWGLSCSQGRVVSCMNKSVVGLSRCPERTLASSLRFPPTNQYIPSSIAGERLNEGFSRTATNILSINH